MARAGDAACGEGYVCLAQAAEHELIVKKSRFLCNLVPVETEDEAAKEIAAIKKKHYDARHHCFAMILGVGGNMEKSSDDGEPQGTAGAPMLEVLRHSGITNILAVVTRYFGGTLLGAGGLVRAYGGAAAGALAKAQTVRKVPAAVVRFCIDYADYSKLQSIAAEYGGSVQATFGEKVEALLTLRQAAWPQAEKRAREAFLGAEVYEVAGECEITEPA